jgi:hypothetical protein
VCEQPLNNLIDDYKEGSDKLEAAKVNVWGQPLSHLLPGIPIDIDIQI